MANEEFKQIRRIEKDQRIAEQLGLTPELLEPRESAFSKFFNFIDKPKQAVLGLLDSALIRGDISKVGIPGAVSRAWEERANTWDLLRREKAIEDPILRGVVGFAGEVALDPLNLITFGGKSAASAGGKALSLAGTETFNNLAKQVAKKTGADLVQSSFKADEVFSSLARFSDLSESFKKTKNVFKKTDLRNQLFTQYEGFKEFLPDVIPNANEFISKMDGVKGLEDFANIVKDPSYLKDLFAKKTLDIGLNVPFVGHLTGRDAPFAIEATDGLFKKTAKFVGNFIKPDKVSLGKIADTLTGSRKVGTKVGEAIPEAFGQMFDQFTMSAAKGVSNLKGYLKNKPVLGSVVKGADLVGDYLSQAKKNLYSIFNVDKLLDPKTSKARQEFIVNGRKVATLKADESVRGILGPNFIDKTFENNQAAMIFDQAQNQVLDTILSYSPNKNKILNQIQSLAERGGEIDVDSVNEIVLSVKESLKALPQFKDIPINGEKIFDDLFINKLDFLIKDAKLDEDQLGLIGRMQNHFNGLKAAEQAEGITSGTIDFYLPHMIKNLSKRFGQVNKGTSGGRGFRQARSYDTVTDLFREGGHLANSDLAEIIFRRTEASHNLINEKRFVERFLLETQSDPKLIQSAWKAAHLGDNDAYEFLKWKGADLSDLKMTSDKLNNLLAPLITEKTLSPQTLEVLRAENGIMYSDLENLLKGRGDLPADISKYLQEGKAGEVRKLLNSKNYRNNLPPDVQAVLRERNIMKVAGGEYSSLDDQIRLSEALGDFTNEALTKAKALGVVDSQFVPLKALGSPAVEYVHDGKVYTLFPHQAKALDDIRNTSDPIKEFAKGNPLLEGVVGWSDWASNFVRKANTVPWLAFHTQNLIGTNMQRMMNEGVLGVLNPGLYAEVSGALKGVGAIKTAVGTITPDDFKKIIKASGLNVSNYDDYVGVVSSLNATNLEKFEKSSRSWTSNLRKMEGATLFNKAAETLQRNFEGFFRITNLVSELKKGSSVPDAINATNKLLFNYRDLTRMESSLFRRLYMFYPWMKKATAQTFHQMYMNPGALSNQIRSARGLAEFFSDPHAAPTMEELDSKLMADIVGREEISFPLGVDDEGKTITGKFNAIPVNTILQSFTLNIPRNFDFTEILGAAESSVVRTIQKQAAQANPIFKAIGEKLSGKNFYFDKPLDSAFLRTVPKMAAVAEKIHTYPYTSIPADLIDAVTVKFLDGIDNNKGGYIVNPTKFWFLTNFVPGLSRAISTANRFSSEKIPLTLAMTHFLTGIRISETDAQRNRLTEVEQNLNNQLEAISSKQQLQNMRGG